MGVEIERGPVGRPPVVTSAVTRSGRRRSEGPAL